MVTYFFIGAIIGALTGVPIGPVNVAVIDTAYRHTIRRAIAVGAGGALADGIYALVGVLGVGPILEQHPAIPPILYGVSGVVLIIYGVVTVRTRPAAAVGEVKSRAPDPSSNIWSGFLLGVALIILNPAAIVTWVVIVGSFMTDLTAVEGIAASIGVAVGSFTWFTTVAYLANHGQKLLGEKAIWITRVVGMLLVGYGIFSIGRAAYLWFW